MVNYITKEKNEYEVYACFNLESDKLLKICENVSKVNSKAYLNCYNWEALLFHYIQNNSPDLLVDLDTDVEDTDFIAIYQINELNESKVDKFISIISDFVENDDKLLHYVKEFSNEIEWE